MLALCRLPNRLSVLFGWLAGVSCCVLLALTATAQQAVPALTGHVIDHTNTLDAQQLQQLEHKLLTFEQSSGAQVVLLLVPSTQPEDIAAYAQRVGDSWKIGRKGIGDGLLLVVAKNDHRVNIQVAKSLEGAIPDLAAKGIIDQSITPHFKQNDFAGGLDAAVDQIAARIKGEALPAPKPSSTGGFRVGFQWNDLLIFAFFGVPIMAAVARRALGAKVGALATGAVVGTVALLLTSSFLLACLAAIGALLFALFSAVGRSSGTGFGSGWGGTGGGWGSGSSGGGFSSGGGGDFGGGGASGDW